MLRTALLINDAPAFEDGNNFRFASLLQEQGQEVDIFLIDTLQLHRGDICAMGFRFKSTFEIDSPLPEPSLQTINHNVVWLLGLGDRTTFLDKYQLLFALPDQCMLINSLEAIMHLKSKYFLASRSKAFPNPETYASSNADALIDTVRSKGGDWIVKPPAGSLGVDVFRVSERDVTLESTISQLCGPDNNRYTLLQQYVPEIEKGEKRVLLAGGRIIGQYLRRAESGSTTNLHQGASAFTCELSEEERVYCEQLAVRILGMGAYFAGIDLAWPWLIEINVINPGGITTIDELTGRNLAPDVVSAVLASLPRTP